MDATLHRRSKLPFIAGKSLLVSVLLGLTSWAGVFLVVSSLGAKIESDGVHGLSSLPLYPGANVEKHLYASGTYAEGTTFYTSDSQFGVGQFYDDYVLAHGWALLARIDYSTGGSYREFLWRGKTEDEPFKVHVTVSASRALKRPGEDSAVEVKLLREPNLRNIPKFGNTTILEDLQDSGSHLIIYSTELSAKSILQSYESSLLSQGWQYYSGSQINRTFKFNINNATVDDADGKLLVTAEKDTRGKTRVELRVSGHNTQIPELNPR